MATAGEKQREAKADWARRQLEGVASIGKIPAARNRLRRNVCRLDLHRFLVTYFPRSTGLSPFSPDHKRVIERIQRCILDGGRFVNAVYRGFAKTTISENAAIWATLYGHRRFAVIFGADAPAAEGNIDSIKSELDGNDLLYEDFPEVCHPVRKLEGRAQRKMSQSYNGKRTMIEWTSEIIVLPTIPKSKASGAVICARGITAGFRGLKAKLPDGTQQRPDLVILDDPQTDESAGSVMLVSKTLSKLRKAVVKLGGHRRQLAIVVNATVIEPDDAVDVLLADNAWQGERIPLVRKWPDCHKTLWLEDYAKIRGTYNKDAVGDQARAWAAATAFYGTRREEMDRGAEVSWDNCFDPEHELSALQHAYNALIDDGEEAFASEYQIRPLPRVKPQPDDLKPDEIRARLTRCQRGSVPVGSTRLTAMIDVGGDLLWYAVVAWNESFGGAVIDYGPWPDQGRPYVFNAEARPTLKDITGVASLEGSIYAGLERLTGELFGRRWGDLAIERCLIDDGWGLSTDAVDKFCRQSAHAAVLLPSKGMGISAAMSPVSDWPKRLGERRGDAWVMRPPEPGKPRRVLFDANRWKSFLAARLKQPVGEPGALLLFGNDAAAHKMIADHCCAEHRVHTSGRGRQVEEWKLPPNRPDNHLFDTLVGAAVAASILGIQVGGLPKKATTKPRMTMQQMQAAARAGR